MVDNASADDSVARILAAHPEVRIHRNPRNEGFAGGVNPGIRAALDAGADLGAADEQRRDAAIPTRSSRLLAAARARPDAGLLGGKIYRDRARRVLWCCGVRSRLRARTSAGCAGSTRWTTGGSTAREVVDSLTGCGLLVRREVFEKIGLFDERYFAYVEDADFALRAARGRASRASYEPRAVFEHPGGGSTGGGYSPGRKYLTAHGAARFLKRHGAFGSGRLPRVRRPPLAGPVRRARSRKGARPARGRSSAALSTACSGGRRICRC